MSDWKEELYKTYPELFERCSIDIGDGWENIMRSLCTMMTEDRHIITAHNGADADGTPTFTQIKEKFGALRIYATKVSIAQDAYISFAEEMSRYVCEVCGNPGKIRTGGWIQTRCDEHSTKQ
jgi:hypothetical protein